MSSKKEKDFIRGKSTLPTTSSDHIIQKKGSLESRDQLFGVRKRKTESTTDSNRKAKKRQKKSKNDSEDLLESDDKVVIESMTLSRLPEGIVIYGCIQEISDFDLKLSVCGGIVTTVSITDISSPYTRLLQIFTENESIVSSNIEVLKPNGMFKIGQYFPIKILSKSVKTEGFSTIEVKASMNPKDIYRDCKSSSLFRVPQIPIIAAVDSIEDHGFVMDIGFEDIKAFLPKDKAQTAIRIFKGRQTLSVGQLVLCSIDSVSNDRSVVLTTNSKYLSEFKLTHKHEADVSCLTPGLTVPATVMNVSERGLEVYILNTFKGFVTRIHLKNDWELPKNIYKIGDKIDGIILYRHPITKQIALSLKPIRNSKSINNFIQNAKIGNIYEEAVVMGRDDCGYFVFRLEDGTKAICHKKHLLDKDVDDVELENKYSIGSSHRCRVKAINLMDSLVLVTLKQSAFNFPFVSDNDLKVGALFRGKVKRMTKNGAVIQISFGINGFVPNMHLTETAQIKNSEQLFPKGKVVKCRIFRIDKSCIPIKVSLTCKKTLVAQKLILSSYENAKPGLQTDGVIVLVNRKGILVEFFNDVKGFIPLKFLSSYRIENPENVFTVGQIVKCTVVDVDLDKERITCSLMKVKDKALKNLNNLKVGQILQKMKISKKTSNGYELTNESNKTKVFLPFGHLSDDIDLTKLLSQSLTVGDLIQEVMVFTIKVNLVIVTRKPTFINASKNNEIIESVEQLKPNQTIPVVISGFATYGIFVEMPANITGLVSKKWMTDGPIDEPNKLGFALYQTVFARFIEFEENTSEDNEKVKKKLKFSLKLSHVWDRRNKTFDDRVIMFGNFVKDLSFLVKTFRKNNEDIDRKLTNFRVGGIVFYSITGFENCQIICEVRLENDKKENSVKGIGLTDSSDTEVKVGSSGIAIVAEIDFIDKNLVILIRPKMAKQVKNSIKINAISSVKCEQTVKSTAIYICNKYVLTLLAGHVPGLIAYIPSKRHLNDRIGTSQHFSLNECYHVVIKSIIGSSVISVLKPQSDNKDKKPIKQILETSETIDETTDNSEKENDSEKIENNATVSKNSEKTTDIKEVDKQQEKSENEDSEIKVLKVNKPFIWSAEESESDLDSNISDSDSEETDSEKNKIRKTRKERNEEVRRREEELRQRETSLMDPNKTPETVDDLERSVLSSPNSSMVWLKYMAFHLEQAELNKARDVAERALKTISFREERERLNVWVAFLNLENIYGTQQTLNELFDRALQYNEPVVIFRHLANIYCQSNKEELAEQIFNTMIKKFRQNKNVWIDLGMFYMKNNRLESARKLLQRSLTCLEKRDHIEVISKFAQMECQWGEVEQSKTLFEKVLANFPKRIDLWSVYIDMMLKYGLKRDTKETEDWVRNIFERLITFKLSAKQMKFIFKRYINFEKQFNNFERIDRIRQKALEYVEGTRLS